MKTETYFRNLSRNLAALTVILPLITTPVLRAADTFADHFRKGLEAEEVQRDPAAAINAYHAALDLYDEQRAQAATVLFRLAECQRKLNQTNEATAGYTRLLREFQDQTELVSLSRQRLSEWNRLTAAEVLAATNALAPAGAGDFEQILSQLTAKTEEDGETKEIASLEKLYQDSPDLLNTRDNSGRTRLHRAAKTGKTRLVEFLLDHGASVDAQDDFGRTPLHEAVVGGEKTMIHLLLRRGASVKLAAREGDTPLHYAAGRGYLSIAEDLLRAGAEVDAWCKYRGDIPRTMPPSQPDLALLPTSGTPLFVAVAAGHLRMVECLVSNRANVNLVDKDRGETPLTLALRRNRNNIARYLLEVGADIRLGSPLHAAIEDGNDAGLDQLLARQPNLEGRDRNQLTALQYAVVAKTDVDRVKRLLQAGADPNARFSWETHPRGPSFWPSPVPSNLDITPLHYAASDRDERVLHCEILLDAGADPTLTNRFGWTPLHCAAQSGSVRAAQLLVAHKADINARTDEGWTPLHLAASNRQRDMVSYLLANGADPKATSADSKTALDLLDTGTRGQAPVAGPARVAVPSAAVGTVSPRALGAGPDETTAEIRKLLEQATAK